MYDLPNYFVVALLSFWVPTIIYSFGVWIWSKHPKLTGRLPVKAATVIIPMTIFIHLAGWVLDAIWLHSLALNIALAGSIICGVWAMVMVFFYKNPAADGE